MVVDFASVSPKEYRKLLAIKIILDSSPLPFSTSNSNSFCTYTPRYTTELNQLWKNKTGTKLDEISWFKIFLSKSLVTLCKQSATHASCSLDNELVIPKSRKERALEKSPWVHAIPICHWLLRFLKIYCCCQTIWCNKKYLCAWYLEFNTSEHEIHSSSLNTSSFMKFTVRNQKYSKLVPKTCHKLVLHRCYLPHSSHIKMPVSRLHGEVGRL